MGETADGYDALIKWHTEVKNVMDTGSAADDEQLEMAVDDENIKATGVAGNDQAYMFIAGTSELQQSLGRGIFGTESVAGGIQTEQQNGEMLTSEADVRSFENITEPNVLGFAKREESSDNTAELSVNSCPQQDNPHPLGSSQNPIRIIQQGNKYTSVQELSPEQLNQIMQVIQQQQLLQTSQSSVLFNPETQTKIIYRVVYPSGIRHSSKSARKPRHLLDCADAENSRKDRTVWGTAKKMQRHRRTRSGRVCRPPQYMVEDYKEIHTVEYEAETSNADGLVCPDGKENGEDEANNSDVPSRPLDFDEAVPTAASGKPKSFKCATCEKRYVGQCGLARHYRLQPTHGSVEDLAPVVNAAEHKKVDDVSDDVSTQLDTSSVSVSADGSNSVPPSEVETVHPTAAEDRSSIAVAVSETEPAPPTPLVVPLKRKRGRPPLHTRQTSERRHAKLLDLMQQCTTEELIEVVLPSLASSLSLWQYLSARSRAVTSSPSATSSTAAVAADVANSDVDVATVLDEYAALHRNVRVFCEELLEKDTLPSDNQVAPQSPEKVANSALPDVENWNPGNDSVADTETSAVADTDSLQNVDDSSTDRTVASCSDRLHTADLSVIGNCSEDVSSVQVNGDLSESGVPRNSEDRVSVHNSESKELNTSKVPVCRDAPTTESFASDEKKDTETGSVSELNGSRHTVFRVSSESSEANGSLTSGAAETSDNVELLKLDCCERNCSVLTLDVADGEACDAVKTSVVETAEASCREDDVSSVTVANIQPATECQTVCSESADESSSTEVMVVDDILEIKDAELARCLGLSIQTRYHLKALEEVQDKLVAQPDIPLMEIPSSAVNSDSAENTRDLSLWNSVPIPMLPPRKRLKLSQSEHNIEGAEDTGSAVAVAEVGKAGHTDTNCRDDSVVSRRLESKQSSEIQSPLANCKKEPQQDGQPHVADSGTVTSVCSADVVPVTNLNFTAKNSFASLSQSQQPRPASFSREQTRRRRKPRQTTTTTVPAVPPRPAAVHQNWAAANPVGESRVVALAASPLVASPTPDVIQIPEDARVLQTEDGLVIVCQSDGTVQIHGHTEGQPIPLDAIQSLLAMDTAVVAVGSGNQVVQESGPSLYSEPVSIANSQTDYVTADQIMGAVGTQNVVPVDGRQYVTMDGGATLMAYDPETQSVVQIDAGQDVITLSDGNTLVAVDSCQP